VGPLLDNQAVTSKFSNTFL